MSSNQPFFRGKLAVKLPGCQAILRVGVFPYISRIHTAVSIAWSQNIRAKLRLIRPIVD